MKDLRPIEEQISELTDKQKSNIPKVFAAQISIILIVFAVIICIFCFFAVSEEQCTDRYELLDVQSELNELNGSYDFSLYEEKMELLDKIDMLYKAKFISLIAGCIIGMVVILAVQIIINKGFPYYSEQKLIYLLKTKKQNNKH